MSLQPAHRRKFPTNIVNPIRKLFKRVNFFAGEVDGIDLEQKTVEVSRGNVITSTRPTTITG